MSKNVNALTRKAEQIQHYYPFGLPLPDSATIATAHVQPYKYNAKELDRMHGLMLYDYGARMYDPQLCRFTSPDRFADKAPQQSVYAYPNNPVSFVDVNGDFPSDSLAPVLDAYERKCENLMGLSLLARSNCERGSYLESHYSNQIAECFAAISEIGVIRNSTQGYDLRKTDVHNTEDCYRGATVYDLGTDMVRMDVPEGCFWPLFAHEMKHAYQFETGEVSFTSKPSQDSNSMVMTTHLYDLTDEIAAYRRGSVWGQAVLPGDQLRNLYQGLPRDNRSILSLVRSSTLLSPSQLSIQLGVYAKKNNIIFRYNGKTYR